MKAKVLKKQKRLLSKLSLFFGFGMACGMVDGSGPQDGNNGAVETGEDDKDSTSNEGSTFIRLTVPPGVEAGVDSLTFNYAGEEVDVLVPLGSVAGDVLQIQVGRRADGADDQETRAGSSHTSAMISGHGRGDSTAASGHTTSSTDLSSEFGGTKETSLVTTPAPAARVDERSSTVMLEMDGKATPLHLCESFAGSGGTGDGTHGMVWPSGKLLAQALTSGFGRQYLSKRVRGLPTDAHGRHHFKCLELGSGSGVGGLALAHALASCDASDCKREQCPNSNAGARVSASVMLTDHGGAAVDLLEKNLRENLPPPCAAVTVEALVWGQVLRTTSSDGDHLHNLILGSDLLYNTQETYDLLLNTIAHHLHPDGVVLLAVRWRKPDLEREFFCKAERVHGLTFELWEEYLACADFAKRSPCRLTWREYGDPESESFNCYFHETTVTVANEKLPLSQVAEKDVERMNDTEYAIFEEVQVQIYVGKYGEKTASRKRPRVELCTSP